MVFEKEFATMDLAFLAGAAALVLATAGLAWICARLLDRGSR